MSDNCSPPEGTEIGTWHWLAAPDPSGAFYPICAAWNGAWGLVGLRQRIIPRDAADWGFRYLGPVAPPEDAEHPTETAQVAAIHSAMGAASDYETEAHALQHAEDVLANLHERGWRLVREEGRDG